MMTPPLPKNEAKRIYALLSYKILDTNPEKDFDNITRLASEICDAPVSIIALMDENRQWFKSKIGLDMNGNERDLSFCRHVISDPTENLIVENALEDERFANNPMVAHDLGPKIRSYVGVPLIDPDGYTLGTLCVFDNRVKKYDEYQIQSLVKLASQTMKLLELRKSNYKLVESHNQLLERYKDLEQFSSVVSHDLKSPLNNIIMLSDMVRSDYGKHLDDEGKQMLGYIEQSADQLKKLIDGILEHYKYDTMDVTAREHIDFRGLTSSIIALLNAKDDIDFIIPDESAELVSNKMALTQIMLNLIVNAIKYNDKERCLIDISFQNLEDGCVISVKDNGIGIPSAHFDKIFEIFGTLGKTDRFNAKGTGIGLTTVDKLLRKLGGHLDVESEVGTGTIFKISLPK